MNKLVALLVMVAALGCNRGRSVGMNPEASAKFRAAWEKRQAGDEAGYRAGLKEVADKYPGSRAGERAKDELAQGQSGGGSAGMMMGAAAAGVAAAVAVPAFMKYRARAADAGHGRPDLSGPIGIKPSPRKGWDPLK
jgi:hypothetical protein